MKTREWILGDCLKIPTLYLIGLTTTNSLSNAIAMIKKLSLLTAMFFKGFKR